MLASKSLISLAFSLVLAVSLASCADTSPPFTPGDSGTPTPDQDTATPDQFVFPDQGPGSDAKPTLWQLYAHDREQLLVIDPLTLKLGQVKLTLVGTFSFDKEVPDNERSINDMAVTPDGELYAVSKTTLYRIDPQTAHASKVAEVKEGADKNPPPNVALTFERSGQLLASDKDGALRRIHYTGSKKGQVELIGSYGSGLKSSGDLVAIKDGTLYGASDEGSGASKENNLLIRVDPKTGQARVVGAIGHGYVWGLAYWAGVIYGFTAEPTNPGTGKLLRIDPDTGKGTLLVEYPYYPYQFWGAAVTPMAPIN